jgi:hypothetical protein
VRPGPKNPSRTDLQKTLKSLSSQARFVLPRTRKIP